MAKREGQKKKRGSALIKIIVSLCIAYFMFSLIASRIELSSKNRELEQIQVQVEQQRIENKETERLISMNEDKKYIERIARDKLDYAYPDERVFIDISGTK